MTKQRTATTSQLVTIDIDCPLPAVTAFLAEPLNLKHWASGLGHSLRLEENVWLADGPGGTVRLRFCPANALGIADHWAEIAPGREVYVPLRALAHGSGTQVQLTLFRQPEMSDADFARDANWVARDLAALKVWLETATKEQP